MNDYLLALLSFVLPLGVLLYLFNHPPKNRKVKK